MEGIGMVGAARLGSQTNGICMLIRRCWDARVNHPVNGYLKRGLPAKSEEASGPSSAGNWAVEIYGNAFSRDYSLGARTRTNYIFTMAMPGSCDDVR